MRFTPAFLTDVLELYERDNKICIRRHGDMSTWDVSRLSLADVPRGYRYSELQIPGVCGYRYYKLQIPDVNCCCSIRRLWFAMSLTLGDCVMIHGAHVGIVFCSVSCVS